MTRIHARRIAVAASLALACCSAQAAFLLAELPAPESTIVDHRVGKLLPDAAQLARAKELRATRYQFVRPFVVDSSLTEKTFGLRPTELDAALRAVGA